MRVKIPELSGAMLVALLSLAGGQGCLGSVRGGDQSGGGIATSTSDAGTQDAGLQVSASTFEALPPATYVSKVKNLLIGLPGGCRPTVVSSSCLLAQLGVVVAWPKLT